MTTMVDQNDQSLEQEIPSTVIEERAQLAIQRAIEFFAGHGLSLQKVPTVRYVGGVNPVTPETILAVQGCEEEVQDSLRTTAPHITKAFFDRFGLFLSNEAVEEMRCMNGSSPENGAASNGKGESSQGTPDIVIYSLIQAYGLDFLDQLMAHELWHMIEEERGLIGKNGAIYEGTATYVQHRFVGVPVRKRRVKSHGDILFNGCALIVQRVLKDEGRKLVNLLRDDVRERIREQFEANHMHDLAEGFVDTILSRKVATKVYATGNASCPDVFDRESYLQYLESEGRGKLAAELSSQNLEPLLAFYNQAMGHA